MEAILGQLNMQQICDKECKILYQNKHVCSYFFFKQGIQVYFKFFEGKVHYQKLQNLLDKRAEFDFLSTINITTTTTMAPLSNFLFWTNLILTESNLFAHLNLFWVSTASLGVSIYASRIMKRYQHVSLFLS